MNDAHDQTLDLDNWQTESTPPHAAGNADDAVGLSSAEQKRTVNGYSVFAAVFLALCLLPFAGMLWAPTDATSGTSDPVSMPTLIQENGSPNIDYLSELGAYFEDHFAYRNEAIDINAHIRVSLFATSPTDQVVVGTDGWLYYGGTLNNYLGRHPLSQRKIDNIAFNLSLMQGYTEAKGAQFAATIAPNKNSLYPEYMPYYLLDGNDPSMDLLRDSLAEANVKYLDAFALFEAEEEELYFRTDSHWNNEGALLVTDALLNALSKSAAHIEAERVVDDGQNGDIEAMLYPVTAAPESATEIDVGDWSYVGEAESAEDSVVGTKASGDGSLLMFRDSFANNLIPLLAPEFEDATFSKLIPYDFTQLDTLKPDYVVIERAQRHAGLFAENPPIMPAPRFKIEATSEASSATTVSVSEDGGFSVIEGWVDPEFYGAEDSVYIEIVAADGTRSAFVPFHVSRSLEDLENAGGGESDNYESVDDLSSDCGFKAFLPRSAFTEGEYTARILVSRTEAGDVVSVGETQLTVG